MGVADASTKKQDQHESEHRIANIAVQPRHGARFDAALKPRAHALRRTFHEAADHPNRLAKIVRTVGISHHEIGSIGRPEAARKCGAVATLIHVDDPYAE